MKLLRYLKDVFLSSLPLVAVIVVVCVIVSPMSGGDLLKVLIGYICVVIGQTFFLMGLDGSIMPIGKLVGDSLIKLKKAAFIILFGFLFGFLATVAEPALSVMAGQVSSINPEVNRTVFIFVLSAGVGAGVGLALFRVMKDISIKVLFFVFYVVVFILAFLTPNQYVALAFDGSGATTGDVSVPFILAMGMGVSSTMSKAKTNDESFGIVGIASIGPIIAVFIYGMIMGNNPELQPYVAGQTDTIGDILLSNLSGVALAIVPIIAVFLLFQFALIKLPKKQLLRLLASGLVVYVGLYIFLVGIDYGFAYAGKHIGESFMDPAKGEGYKWILLAVGFVLGFAITLTEPAVAVLGEQVEEITTGHIKKMTIRMTLAVGIGVAGFVSILKILLDINILWLLVPLYAIALAMLPFTPKLFVGLAFDSGGVTGGAITSAFLTPLTLGVSQALGQEILTAGFGMIAFISVMPLIAVQLLGINYARQQKKLAAASVDNTQVALENLLDDAETWQDDEVEVLAEMWAEKEHAKKLKEQTADSTFVDTVSDAETLLPGGSMGGSDKVVIAETEVKQSNLEVKVPETAELSETHFAFEAANNVPDADKKSEVESIFEGLGFDMGIDYVVVIADRKKKDDLVRLLEANSVSVMNVVFGRGFAKQSIFMESIGMVSDLTKVVVTGLVSSARSGGLIEALNEELSFKKRNTGIAFTVSVDKMSF